jgi:AraC-like DNA-binding protein
MTIRSRIADVAVDDFLRDNENLQALANDMGQQLWDEMQKTLRDQVRTEILKLNIPDDMQAAAVIKVTEASKEILPRMVASLVGQTIDQNISSIRMEYARKLAEAETAYQENLTRLSTAYETQIQGIADELSAMRESLKVESRKRRAVHRSLVAFYEDYVKFKKKTDQSIAAVQPVKKKRFWSWGRKKEVVPQPEILQLVPSFQEMDGEGEVENKDIQSIAG